MDKKSVSFIVDLLSLLKSKGLVNLDTLKPKEPEAEKPIEPEVKPKTKTKKPAIEIIKLELPEYMENEEKLRGVCVGACIYTGKWAKGKRAKDKEGNFIKNAEGKYLREPGSVAHAHTGTKGPFHGYICFSSREEFNKHLTCKHELAHIATDEGHTQAWAEKYVSYGGPKWLTVEWLRNKYGFDEAGGEGTKVFDDWRKWAGLDNETEQEGEKKDK